MADIAVMAEKSDYQKNIQHYLDENPDWDYRQAEQQAFIDAALQIGGATVGGWFTGSAMGAGYSKIQSIANSFHRTGDGSPSWRSKTQNRPPSCDF